MTVYGVVGGGGFLGGHIVSLLLNGRKEKIGCNQESFEKLQSVSHSVRKIKIIDKKISQKRRIELQDLSVGTDIKLEFLTCDIASKKSVLDSLVGCDVIIHNASVIDFGTLTQELVMRINVRGTQNIIDACKELGISSVVYTGSVGAIGPNKNFDSMVDIDAWESKYKVDFPNSCIYGRTKRLAEQIVRESSDQKLSKPSTYGSNTLRTITIAPPAMYGENDWVSVQTLSQTFPITLMPACSNTLYSYAYIGNVAFMHILAADYLYHADRNNDTHTSYVKVFAADETTAKTFYDHAKEIYEPIGVKTLPMPVLFFLFLGLITELIFYVDSKIFASDWARNLKGKSGLPVMHYMRADCSVSYKAAEKELGYRPLFSYKQSLSNTHEWLRDVKAKMILKKT